MKNFFNLEGPFMQFLARVFDLMLVNLLFIICCIPVVTIGASIAALHKVTQDIVYDSDHGVWKRFFAVFKENFAQATVAWLLLVFFLVGMACNAMLVATYFKGATATLFYGIIIVLVVIVLSVVTYLFPLIVRYRNGLKQHLFNAAVLTIYKLPKTILMLAINTFPFWILYFSLQAFIQTLVFWMMIGFAFISYMDSTLLESVFASLEAEQEEEKDQEA